MNFFSKDCNNLALQVSEIKHNENLSGYVFRFDTNSTISVVDKGSPFPKDANTTSEKIISFEDINENFVPENKNFFHLDPLKKSYLINPKNLDSIREKLKFQAEEKLKVEENENEESEITSEIDSSSINYTNSSYSESSAKRTTTFINNDNYYKVDLKNVKLLIYDHKKHNLAEATDDYRVYQVEARKFESYSRKNLKLSNNDKKQTEEKENKNENIEIAEENSKEGVLISQIELALKKEDKLATVIRLKWTSFFIFASILGIFSAFIFILLSYTNNALQGISIIDYSRSLFQNLTLASTVIRELVLLNNPLYTNICRPLDIYIRTLFRTLVNLYNQNFEIIMNLSLLSSLSTFKTDILKIKSLNDDLSVDTSNIIFSAGLSEINTAVFHIANMKLTDIISTNKDVFFTTNNINTGVYSLNDKNINFSINNLKTIISNCQLNLLYIMLAFLGFLVLCYFLFSKVYSDVKIKKESYLEIFFEINSNVISNSMEKCEIFLKRLQFDEDDEGQSINEDDLLHETSALTVKKPSSSKKRKLNRKSTNSKEEKMMKLKVVTGLLFTFAIILIIYLKYIDQMTDIQAQADIYIGLYLVTIRAVFFYTGSTLR